MDSTSADEDRPPQPRFHVRTTTGFLKIGKPRIPAISLQICDRITSRTQFLSLTIALFVLDSCVDGTALLARGMIRTAKLPDFKEIVRCLW